MKNTRTQIYGLPFFFLLGIVFLLFSACRGDKEPLFLPSIQVVKNFNSSQEHPLVEFIMNPKNRQSKTCNQELAKTMDYTKIPYNQLQVEAFNKNQKIANTTRAIGVYNLDPFNQKSLKALLKFVTAGGTLFIASVSETPKFGFFAGVKQHANYYTDVKPIGYHFNINVVPDMKGKNYQNGIEHYGLKKENYSDKIQVWATAINEPETPTILKNSIGKGKVVVLNTTQNPEKQDRGLFFAAILSGLPQIPYPMANTTSIFLDDFPSPVYNMVKEPIKSELNLNEKKFYTEVWWPDILSLAKQQGLRYTAMTCFDYRNETNPPFLFPEWKASSLEKNGTQQIASNWMVHQVQKNGFELALHGYNHVSLLQQNWPNQKYMALSLNSARKFWKSNRFGQFPITYVPPSNDIDSVGISALRQVMPSIRYLCSTYSGSVKRGGGREFDQDPYNPFIFDFPRVTSGFVVNDLMEFSQQSLYLYTGIWTHFLHPDDVYQIPDEANQSSRGNYEYRNKEGLGWRISKDGSLGMFPRFKHYIQHTKSLFPMMRFFTVSKAAPIVENWRNDAYQFQGGKKVYTVSLKNSTQKPQPTYWFTYVQQAHETEVENYLKSKKYSFTKVAFLNGDLYNIKTPSASLSLPNAGSVEMNDKKNDTLFATVNQQYQVFLENKPIFKNEDEKIKYKVQQGKTQEAVALLKKKVLQEKRVNPEDWQKLFAYMGWENRQAEIWPVLEEKYQQGRNPVLARLAKKFVEHSDYPNLKTRKLWMQRQLKLTPGDTQLKMEYALVFGNTKNNTFSYAELSQVLQSNKNLSEKQFALTYLLNHYPKKTKSILKNISTHNDGTVYAMLASNIAYFYADDGNYQKAIAWGKKAKDIRKVDVAEWQAKLGNFEHLKALDYSRYIAYLLANRPQKATAELIEKTPCTDTSLTKQTADIAYAFANQGSYRKALDWAQCDPKFSLATQLQWKYELGAFAAMEKMYAKRIAINPHDHAAKAYMSSAYAAQGDIKKAWLLAASLPPSAKRDTLQKQLNKAVVYIPQQEQQQLLKRNPGFFFPEVAKKITRDLRLAQHDFIAYQGKLITDRFEPTSFENKIAYGMRDAHGNTHSVGLTKYAAYELNLGSVTKPANRDHDLYGVEYEFKSKQKNKKFSYGARARVEVDQNQQFFYQGAFSAALNTENFYSGLAVSIQPAITAPAYSLGIYRAQLNLYEELQLKKRFSIVLGAETNYYTDKVIDGLLVTKLVMNNKLTHSGSLHPYLEVSGMLSSEDRRNGFPYWTIDQRLYGGLGTKFTYKNTATELSFNLNAAAFLDSYSDSFARFRGQISYPIFNYFYLSGSAEFFTLKNFYSNNFDFGMTYYF